MPIMASENLVKKLRPDNFTAMSGQFAAIVGYFVGVRFASPAIDEIVVSGESVLIRHAGDPGFNEVYGTIGLLKENWAKLLAAAGLTEAEGLEATALFEAKIGRAVPSQMKPPSSVLPPDYHPPTSQN